MNDKSDFLHENIDAISNLFWLYVVIRRTLKPLSEYVQKTMAKMQKQDQSHIYYWYDTTKQNPLAKALYAEANKPIQPTMAWSD
jgi:hypothetical protein